MRSPCLSSLAKKGLHLASALCFPLALGCSSDHDRVEKQLQKLREQVSELQSDSDRVSERLDAMEARVTAPAPDHRLASAAPEAITRPKLKVVRVSPDGDGSALDAPAEAEADAGPRVVIQGEGKSLETRTLPAAKPAPKPETPAPAKK